MGYLVRKKHNRNCEELREWVRWLNLKPSFRSRSLCLILALFFWIGDIFKNLFRLVFCLPMYSLIFSKKAQFLTKKKKKKTNELSYPILCSVKSHLGWREKRNIPYKNVKTSTYKGNMRLTSIRNRQKQTCDVSSQYHS